MIKRLLALAVILAILFPLTVHAQFSSGTTNSKQSGTWTVQPGNTANTTAWLVTGTGGQFPATQSGVWTVQPGNTANTTAWLVTGTGGTFPTTPAALTTFFAAQQAVTASAVALGTNTAKLVCVKALIANGLTVYIGPTGVTTATGMELAPGDSQCLTINNSNAIFVIASGTGSSVSYDGLN